VRPLRLEVEAVGPFATRQVVDFDSLGDEGLFLIWGPTGAGKSFLLDALCFALYGRTAGDRPVLQLHSDHARHLTPTVELTFRLDGDEWRVRRDAPRWRTRRDGTVTQGSSNAVLERRGPDGEFVEVARKVREVDGLLRERIGLAVDDFRRVVLLPQGRFERVLQATSAEREDLLKSIFGTSLFEEVAAELDARASAAARAIDEVEHDQRRRVEAAAADWRRLVSDLADDEAGLAGAVDLAELSTVGEALAGPDGASALPGAAEVLGRVGVDVGGLTGSAEADARRLRSEADSRGERAARWDERAAWRRRRSERLAEKADIEAARAESEAAERAAPVGPRRRAAREADRRRDDAAAAHRSAVAALEQAWSTCPVTLAAPLQGTPLAVDDLLEVDAAWLMQATAVVGRRAAEADEAIAAAGRLVNAERAATDALDEAERGADALAALRDGVALAEGSLVETRRQAATAEGAHRSVDDLAATVATLAKQSAAGRRVPALDEAVSAADRATLEARLAETEARLALSQVHRRRSESMAAELAAALEAGEACPVCGAVEHPAPAAPIEGAPTEDDVERAERDLDAAIADRRRAEQSLAEATAARAEGRAAAGPAADDPDALADVLGARRGELDRAQRATEEIAALTARTAELEATLATARAEVEATRSAEASARSRAAVARRDAERERAAITAVLGRDADTATAERARERLAALASALSESADARDEARRAEAAAVEARGSLAAAVADAGFDDEAAADAAWRSEADRIRLRDRIAVWERAVAEAEVALAQPALADLGDERPAVSAAERAAKVAEARHTALVRAHTRIESTADQLAALVADHAGDEARLVADRAEHEVRHRLAQLCNGRTGDRVSLQRWVLAAHFEQICARANDRLRVMTSGRYSLRVHTGSTHGRGSGLDLKVLDSHSGEERDVATLSGGETFQASLALALGVADVVAERAGGLDLDVLFIDEGFGTLDADALHLALDELDRLRAGGRMVGVISHVAGLRERITAGIEVRPDRVGSRVLVGAAPEA